jgi:hypothetical protein
MSKARDEPTPAKKRTPGSAAPARPKRVADKRRVTPRAPVAGARGDGDKVAEAARPRVPRSTKRSAVPGPPDPRAEGTTGAPKAKGRRPAPPRAADARAPHVAAPEASRVAVPRGTPVSRDAPFSPALSPGRGGDADPDSAGHVMELHWGEETPSSRRGGGLVQRWVKRGNALLRHLAEHGAARHEYRADLKEGRFMWVDADGRVSAEARAQVLCSWSRATSALSMAWADPLVRGVGISRIDGVPGERDDVDEETAWRVAMRAADRARADFLYRVTTPHAWYFLALSGLTFHPETASFSPGTPVALVRRGLGDSLRAVESRAEPAEVVRDRIASLGQALLFEAEYAYRATDWVARLERTGRRLLALSEQLPRPSYGTLAAGRLAGEWLDRQSTLELSDALALLEDEWALFT